MARDRFDHKVDHSDVTKPVAVRRMEVMTGVERRRRWSSEDKLVSGAPLRKHPVSAAGATVFRRRG